MSVKLVDVTKIFTDQSNPDKKVVAVNNASLEVAEGEFQAHMHIALVNDGPVTLLLDSKKGF